MYWLIFLSEYKRARAEIKKCAADTVRLQKKVKKGELRVTDSSVSLADDRVWDCLSATAVVSTFFWGHLNENLS